MVEFGKYILQRKIAEGGMAEVFLAKQAGMEGFEKPVVVKRILPHLCGEESFVQMFLNEARVAARLSHPSIVQIFDLGRVGEQFYIAMEYIHGEDLRGLAKQAEKARQRPSFAIIARILADVLGALHYAHTRSGPDGRPLGLVHRDISPQNVLVTYEGGVKLVDFGIAKATESQNNNQTQAGLLKGKYAYMSPEQCRGRRIDARSDIFSVGILLWELITWRRLFRRDNDMATLVAVADEPIPTLRSIREDVPQELDDICARSLERDTAHRYPTAQAMQAALEQCIRRYAWEADSIALQHYMHGLFAEKLAQQDNAVRAAGLGSIEDYLVRVDEATRMVWMEQKTPSHNTPGVAMPFREVVTEPAAQPRRVQPPRPGEAFVIAPVPQPMRPTAPLSAQVPVPAPPPAEEDMTPSTMRHAVGQQVPTGQTQPGLQTWEPPPQSSPVKRLVVAGTIGIVLGGGVLAALFWEEFKPGGAPGATGVTSSAGHVSVSTVRVQLDQPAEVSVDGAAQPPGREVEVQVTAGQTHELVIKPSQGGGAVIRETVPALAAGAVHVVRKKLGP